MASGAWKLILVFAFVLIGNCVASTDSWEFATNECYITEPIYNYTFNYTELKSDLAHTVISNRGDIFDFNICRNLTKACNGQSNVAACMKRDNKEYILGIHQQLTYKHGKMFFTFSNGSECRKGVPYQLFVIVGCDYTMDKNQLQVTPYAEDGCSFYILLESPHACLPQPDAVKSSSCTAKDPSTGYTYNLLALSDSNYRTTDRNGSIFVINVCRPVLYAEAAMCPPGSSVCRLDMSITDPKKMFQNYGTVEANPVVENNQLLIRHNSDTVCNSTHNFTSIIYFHCDHEMEYGRPDFMGRKGCTYEFTWLNSMACSAVEPCVALDPVTGFRYNMNSLKNDVNILKLGNKSYTFGVCSDAGSPCLEHAGACETINGQSTTFGLANTDLRFNQTGSPYLLYESGAPCQMKTKDKTATAAFWSTKIEFVCAATNSPATGPKEAGNGQATGDAASPLNGPKIIENSNCQLLIHYQTKLACQNQITCKTRGYGSSDADGDTDTDSVGYEMDLTPLISTTDNYEAKVSSSVSQSNAAKARKFYLNVCRPLVPKFGLGCPGGSAACMATMGPSTPEDEQSLGYPDVSLTRINKTSAELKYFRGSPCPLDPSTQLSSTIQFTCDIRAGRGTPVLESIMHDCHFEFVWPTNVICPVHACAFNVSTCEIINDQLGERYSVRKARFTDNGKITIRGLEGFTIDVCGDEHRKASTDYSQGTVKVFFSAAGPCGSDASSAGSVNVQLRLVCAEIEEAASFSDGSHCNLIYTQRTPEICKFLGLEIPKSSTPAPTLATTPVTATTQATAAITSTKLPDPAVKKSGSLTTILVVVVSLACVGMCLGLFLRTPERRDRILRIFRRSTSAVRYSRVESNEEANLLLDQNGQFTDSDDDMLL